MSERNGFVCCDYDGCGAWVQPRNPGDAVQAYDYAESIGWLVEGPRDVCPTHAPSADDRMIETCLVCKVAWDLNGDPPECQEPEHPHALNTVKNWDRVGHGRAE